MHSIIAYPVLALFPFYHCPPLLLCSCYTGPLLFFTYIRYVTSLKILALVRSSRYTQLHPFQLFNHLSVYLHFSFFSIGDFTQSFWLLWHQCRIIYTGECLNFGLDVLHNQTEIMHFNAVSPKKCSAFLYSITCTSCISNMSEYEAILILHGSSL